MELNKINKLDELNLILDETFARGIGNSVRAFWGGREFALRHPDGSATIVKMKDLIKKFTELSEMDLEGRKNLTLIDDIEEKILKLDLRGDLEFKQYGWLSEKFRDLKNIGSPAHFKEMDEIVRPLTENQKRTIETLMGRFAKGFVTENSDELRVGPDLKIALMHLLRTKPEVYQTAKQAFNSVSMNRENREIRELLSSIDQEYLIRYGRDKILNDTEEKLESGLRWLEGSLSNKKLQTPSEFADFYYTEDLGFKNLNKTLSSRLEAIEELVANNPGRAFPLVYAMANSNYKSDDSMRDPEGYSLDKKLITAHQNKYKELLKRCEHYLFERIERFGNDLSLSPDLQYPFNYNFPEYSNLDRHKGNSSFDRLVNILSKLSNLEIEGQDAYVVKENPDGSYQIGIKPTLFARLIGMNEKSLYDFADRLKTPSSQDLNVANNEQKADVVIIKDEIDGPLDMILKEARGELLEEKRAIEYMLTNREFSDQQIYEFFKKNDITNKPYYTGTYSDQTNKMFRPFLVTKIAQAFYRGERKKLVELLGISLSSYE